MAILVTTRKASRLRTCGSCGKDVKIGTRYLRIFYTREEAQPLLTLTECVSCAPAYRQAKLAEAPAKRRRKARKAAPAPAPAPVVKAAAARITPVVPLATGGIVRPPAVDTARSVSQAAFQQMMGR